MIEKICLVCGKIFKTYLSSNKKYCCYECSRIAKCTLKEKECLYCHKLFKPLNNRTKYCSKICADKSKKVNNRHIVFCKTCGKTFELIPGHKSKYCSKQCYILDNKNNLAIYNQNNKNKTYEEIYGIEKAKIIKDKQKKHKWSDEDKLRISKQQLGTHRSEKTREKLRLIQLSKEHQEKIIKTKRKNNTFNTSKSEQIITTLLKDKFSDILCQYKSEKYPFNCDFYIPSLDLYIEFQGHWTHGNRPYKNTEDDNTIVNRWKEKAKSSKFYENAIETWVIRDPKKRHIAIENNLHWIEFFTFDEFMDWYKTL